MKNKLLLFLIFIAIHNQLKSQGCSDAGFCTIGTLQPQQLTDTTFKNNFKLTLSYGQGEQGVTIIQTIPEFQFSIFKNTSIQLKVPYFVINGNLGNNNGVGDPSVSITQTLVNNNNLKFSITAGTKIATGKSDAENTGLPLPMPYQTSLGTNDIILGTSLQYKKWNFGLGFQGVLSNKNENKFLHSAYTNNEVGKKYFESNFLNRGNDALLRIEKSFKLKKLNLSTGLLAIYHLQESSLIDDSENRVAIKYSDGLTLNVTGNAQYSFSNRTGINISLGFPTIVRKVRPDGLTRHFLLAVAFNYNFGK
ncbi:hypothetical protein BH11BAC1_BH11BAC1_13050 [soil metagenome]